MKFGQWCDSILFGTVSIRQFIYTSLQSIHLHIYTSIQSTHLCVYEIKLAYITVYIRTREKEKYEFDQGERIDDLRC